MREPPLPQQRRLLTNAGMSSDGLTSPVEHRADLGAKEDKSDDRNHGDERQDQSVFGQSLASIVTSYGWDECEQRHHEGFRASFPSGSLGLGRVRSGNKRTAGTHVGTGGPH